ncbi:cupin domain-containing protein [Salipaludibacillus sp. LMS25]|jgi:mannose-6-phosphate isomerase-like protein (cupin superfamily)|uniref:cupin domain-containing protein n=1 Tax=Salipaludibacillus sp. LMS25 TaxID=2924031 RepID=UPI0020D115EC|nr:cupin domain-containing protein [Salipaludibacillus sp. LMS25]UTR13798.1 cupin domain-containing protein [Salipaludibacillus sp. LMS25]
MYWNTWAYDQGQHPDINKWYYYGAQYNDWQSRQWQHQSDSHDASSSQQARMTDYGPRPFVVDMEEVTKRNTTFRTALWTGDYLQLTLMSINVGEDIGLEVHHDHDQFIRIEEGQGLVQMGDEKDRLNFQQQAFADDAIFVPAGKWHNLTNTGNAPLKLYSIYAPPEHAYGTVHETKRDEKRDREDLKTR